MQIEKRGQSCDGFTDTISAELDSIETINKAFFLKAFFVHGLSDNVRTGLMETMEEGDSLAELSRRATELSAQADSDT